MNTLRIFLLFSTVLIYVMTVLASSSQGINWPAVAINDLIALDWRSQFDTDFLVYLFLGATWVTWREGFTLKGNCFAFLSVFLAACSVFPTCFWLPIMRKVIPSFCCSEFTLIREATARSSSLCISLQLPSTPVLSYVYRDQLRNQR